MPSTKTKPRPKPSRGKDPLVHGKPSLGVIRQMESELAELHRECPTFDLAAAKRKAHTLPSYIAFRDLVAKLKRGPNLIQYSADSDREEIRDIIIEILSELMDEADLEHEGSLEGHEEQYCDDGVCHSYRRRDGSSGDDARLVHYEASLRGQPTRPTEDRETFFAFCAQNEITDATEGRRRYAAWKRQAGGSGLKPSA